LRVFGLEVTNYGYTCPDAIQIKWSVCQANGVLVVA